VPPASAVSTGCCEETNGHCVPSSESNQSACTGAGGHWHTSAICTSSGACEHYSSPSCDTQPYPTCGGPCPAGEVCIGSDFDTLCHCVLQGGCATSAPACNGPCPGGGYCAPLGSGCFCIAGGCACGLGGCGTGYSCVPIPLGPPGSCFCGGFQ
jgi:hypothetical protein